MDPNEKTVEELQLEQIESLKKQMDNMVDPAKYAELQKQYKKLLDDYVNKRPAPIPQAPVTRPTREIAKEFQNIKNSDITNRDYIVKSLEYRDAYIAEFGTDPFTDFGSSGSGEKNADTEEVAGKLKKLLDENESAVSFRIAMNEILKDDPQLIAMIKQRKQQEEKSRKSA